MQFMIGSAARRLLLALALSAFLVPFAPDTSSVSAHQQSAGERIDAAHALVR
jgi:hypothetical protein